MLYIIASFIMTLLYEFMNEERKFEMKKAQYSSSLQGNSNPEFAEFTA